MLVSPQFIKQPLATPHAKVESRKSKKKKHGDPLTTDCNVQARNSEFAFGRQRKYPKPTGKTTPLPPSSMGQAMQPASQCPSVQTTSCSLSILPASNAERQNVPHVLPHPAPPSPDVTQQNKHGTPHQALSAGATRYRRPCSKNTTKPRLSRGGPQQLPVISLRKDTTSPHANVTSVRSTDRSTATREETKHFHKRGKGKSKRTKRATKVRVCVGNLRSSPKSG